MSLKAILDNAVMPSDVKAPDILYDGNRLFIKGIDVSDICVGFRADISGGSVNTVTVTFSNVDAVIKKVEPRIL